MDEERVEVVRVQEADKWLEAKKDRRLRVPVPTKFDDIKEEYTVRQKGYVIQQMSQVQRSTRYQHIQNQVKTLVDKELLRLHLEELVREDQVSLQNVVRKLQAQFASSNDITADHVRQEYRHVLDIARLRSVNPQCQYEDQNRALSRACTYKIPEIEGFLVIKDFLDAISMKLVPV